MNAAETIPDDLPALLKRAVTLLERAVAPALLTRRQAAAYLAVSEGKLKLMRKAGELPGVAVRLGGCVRYRRAGLDRIIGRLPAAK